MPYFKDHQDKVHWLDSAEFAHLLPVGSAPITEAEVEALRQPPPETAEQKEARIKLEIEAIEQREIMPRKTREIQIQVMEYFAATQGLTKEQLYAVNPAYKGMVDIDNQIKALRAQL